MVAVAWPARGINHRFYLPTNFNLRLLQLQCILPSSTFLHLSCRHVHLWGRSARARERTARRGQSPSLRGELARLTEGSVAVLCLGERRWKVSSSVPRRANHEQMSAAASVDANNKSRILDHRRPWARMIKSYPIQGKATHSGSKAQVRLRRCLYECTETMVAPNRNPPPAAEDVRTTTTPRRH